MRLRFGVLLCLLLAIAAAGCRKALEPVTDDNQAPETWITAAPQDTVRWRDESGFPLSLPQLPVRFHLYWAGSDRDGAIAGYYFAVVETIPVPDEGLPLPNLPGPRARDYRFTDKSDSIFIFSTSEQLNERQHAFFVYAVDDKGKPDPTPARFTFRAYDRFPPLAIIEEFRAVGTVYSLGAGGGVQANLETKFVTDSFEVSRPIPRDTVASSSVLTVRWRGEPTIPSTIVQGYRYKLDEPDFNSVDSSVHTVSYNTGIAGDVIAPGKKVFRLRAIGQSGWRGEATRYFQMNYAPDTWFVGPDINDPVQGWQTELRNGVAWRYYRDVPAWPVSIPNTQLSADSVNLLPALRPERKTFFEFYGDRVFARSEGDTVHLNSRVVFPGGGFDRDSPYNVKVGFDPETPPGVVTTIGPPNGSPVAFRSLLATKLQEPETTPGGSAERAEAQFIRPSENLAYPVFDAASPYRSLRISEYQGMRNSGKVYVLLKAEDGDGAVDQRVSQAGGAAAVADRVDGIPGAGPPSAEDLQLRSKILTFYVNYAPSLVTAGQNPPVSNRTITQRINYTFAMPATDIDPFDFASTTGGDAVGGPQVASPVLRRTFTLIGRTTAGNDTTVIIANRLNNQASFAYTFPAWVANGPWILRVQLCDCLDCETKFEHGRCVVTDIPITLALPEPAFAPEHSLPAPSSSADQRPGSREAVSRRP